LVTPSYICGPAGQDKGKIHLYALGHIYGISTYFHQRPIIG
jgi:hypothetical protein